MNLKAWVRQIIAVVLVYSGLSSLLRALHKSGRAAILMYHDPKPEVFQAHLAYLTRHYSLVTLEELVQALRQRQWDRLPPRPLVLTIDDGHKGNRALLDICRRYGAHPTVYLCSQLVDTHRHFWWLHGDLARDPRQAEQLKSLTAEQMGEVMLSRFGYEPQRSYETRHTLDRRELEEMSADFDFQSHGRFHSILTNLDDQASREEIFLSRQELEEITGRPCRHFAYPNGNGSEREKRYLEEAGYLSARTTRFDWVRPDSDPLALTIMGMPDDASRAWAEAYLTGIPGWVHRTWRGLKGADKAQAPLHHT